MVDRPKVHLDDMAERIAKVLKKHPDEVNVRDLADMVWALYGDEVNIKCAFEKKEEEKVDENADIDR